MNLATIGIILAAVGGLLGEWSLFNAGLFVIWIGVAKPAKKDQRPWRVGQRGD